MADKIETPDWFDEAVLLKADGLSARKVAERLRKRGYEVNYNTVWMYVWPAGRKYLRERQSDEWKATNKEYLRQWYKANKRFNEQYAD